jgi:putative ABC transport system permease protein
MSRDFRHALRRLSHQPGFALLAAGTLALGLSTSVAVFTFVSAYTRSIPGVEADRLYQLWSVSEDDLRGAMSYPDFLDLQELDTDAFAVAGARPSWFGATLRRGDFTEVGFGEGVGLGFFSLLRVAMSTGRDFTAEEHRPGATPTAVLDHDYWVSRYGADPDVVGQTILLNNEPYTIVGVAGSAFHGSSAAYRPQFWIPLEQYLRVYRPGSGTRENREVGAVVPLVRLSRGASLGRASDVLQALAGALDAQVPLSERSRRFVLEPATWIDAPTRDAEASASRIMLGASVFLLVLACLNVANLVLSAGARRHSELAVRSAMGASRWRLVRMLLAESLVVSGAAGAVAILLAEPLSSRLTSYFARPSVWGTNVPRDSVVDPRVMLFALGAVVVTGIATGLVPALRASARRPAEALGTRGSGVFGGRARPSWLPGGRDLLASAQIGIAVVLLFVAGLVLRTLEMTGKVDPGFDVRATLASYVSTSSMGVPISERHRFFEELIRRFEDLPWVEAATVSENAPLSSHPTQELAPDDGAAPVTSAVAMVWPGYFETLGMEMVRGRPLLVTDTADATGVVVVNETLAGRLAGDADAVGRSLRWPGTDGAPDRDFEVVGVVRDARQVALLDDPPPVAYFSLPQNYSRPGNALLLKVRGDLATAVDLVERELHAVDSRLAIVNILTYRDVVRGFLYTQRMNAELFSAIAVLGLLLAAAGIFAVVTLAVAARRREIGIRVAVGADGVAITKAVLVPVTGSVMVGLVIGLGGAAAATRVVRSLLWGVAPADPRALTLGVGVLLGAVALAVWRPLDRALRVDPVASLRAD